MNIVIVNISCSQSLASSFTTDGPFQPDPQQKRKRSPQESQYRSICTASARCWWWSPRCQDSMSRDDYEIISSRLMISSSRAWYLIISLAVDIIWDGLCDSTASVRCTHEPEVRKHALLRRILSSLNRSRWRWLSNLSSNYRMFVQLSKSISGAMLRQVSELPQAR